uniref:Uncharacterized protein n=1 Tax=Plectus sambesii TaxID=2011161 RepID=A0A914W9H8_9BILA
MDTARVSTLDTSKDTLSVLLADPEPIKVALSINGHFVQLEHDTGAPSLSSAKRPLTMLAARFLVDDQQHLLRLTVTSGWEVGDERPVETMFQDFPLIFEPGLRHGMKMKVLLELKKDAQSKFIRVQLPPFAVYDAVDKEIDRVANRLQNYAITLMVYSFDFEYVNAEKFGQTVGLSRLQVGNDADFDESLRDRNTSLLQLSIETLTESPVHAADITKATATDTSLQKVMRLHREG